jgi:hypothetical protein
MASACYLSGTVAAFPAATVPPFSLPGGGWGGLPFLPSPGWVALFPSLPAPGGLSQGGLAPKGATNSLGFRRAGARMHMSILPHPLAGLCIRESG